MTDECPKCRENAEKGCYFCGACGRSLEDIRVIGHHPVYEPDNRGARPGPVSIILAISCIFILLVAVFEVITLLVHSVDVFGFLADKVYGFIVIVPFPEVLFRLEGGALQAYWVILILAIVASAVIAIKKFADTAKSSGDIARPDAIENTAAFWVCISMGVMMLINFISVFIVIMTGTEITTPSLGSEAEQMFLLADASVWEEIIARVLYIGVPMTVISLAITRKKESLKCLFGGFGMSLTAVALILISSAVFGLAHSPGWDGQTWKIMTTGIMGVLIGYIFVRFGLYAAILLHFITDYLSSFTWMGVGGFEAVITLALLGVGLVALYYIFARLKGYVGVENAIPNFRNSYIKSD
ncbi:MAG: CPBP family intramembrane metalloprotease [Candidatus Methanoplasma sp.]|jgi:membrane protease YdiL (CAAX protease family)|nr:CPBP family intramembrane metalloprotease [Candidatus Methanoplasma sp.]